MQHHVIRTVYCPQGGIKAVIWTDVFQAAIMYAGMLAILIKVLLSPRSLCARKHAHTHSHTCASEHARTHARDKRMPKLTERFRKEIYHEGGG